VKRTLIGTGLFLLAAAIAYAATFEQRLRVSGDTTTNAGYYLILDTLTCGPESLRQDTTYSDTMDISAARRLGIYYNMGAVTKATKGNDSVWVRWITQVKATNAKTWRSIYRDSAGGNNITTLDDTTVFRSLYADSLCATKLRIQTIIAERATDAFAAAEAETTIVPIYIDVAYRE
jgi:hypothetical protein